MHIFYFNTPPLGGISFLKFLGKNVKKKRKKRRGKVKKGGNVKKKGGEGKKGNFPPMG